MELYIENVSHLLMNMNVIFIKAMDYTDFNKIQSGPNLDSDTVCASVKPSIFKKTKYIHQDVIND